jgi:hypothetical protein
MYTVSITLVIAGPLWGEGEAARGVASATGFAAGEFDGCFGFASGASARAVARKLHTLIIASTKQKSRPAGRHLCNINPPKLFYSPLVTWQLIPVSLQSTKPRALCGKKFLEPARTTLILKT